MSDSPVPIGFVAPDSADLAEFFPGYEIQGLIAAGGMGAVYCAVQKSLERTVALKILPLELSKDVAFCEGFAAEAKAMARLNHPNLIGVYDFGEMNGMLFIIMEFVPGKSIFHSAHGQAIDQNEVIRLISDICDGLTHAHENGIIHRDIKPSNILLDLNAQPKIGDFGLARPIERKIQEGEEIFGTPHYTAPEVVNAPHLVDHRADIFSVGVMLHELLTGRLPADDPRSASSIVRCDPRLDAIIKRATHISPAARYANVVDMTADLQAITATPASAQPNQPNQSNRIMSAGAPRPVGSRRNYKSARPQKSSGASIVLLLLVAAAAGYGYLKFYQKPPAKVDVSTIVVPRALPKVTPLEEESPVNPDPLLKEHGQTSEQQEQAVSPAPVDPVQVEPKFQVAGFFAKARKILQDRTVPLQAVHRRNLEYNAADLIKEFSATMQRKPHKLGVVETMAPQLEVWKELKYRLPADLDSHFASIPEAVNLYAEYLQKQIGIDDTFQVELTKLVDLYITWLEKQNLRLKADHDLGAIRLFDLEIEQTKSDPERFIESLLGTE